MASETMESAIAAEVGSIRRYVNERYGKPGQSFWVSTDVTFIENRLKAIERTLEEGDPRGRIDP